ncbi:N-formylglutamate amidohydrolase, partial [Vibrio parahaemolyticus]
RRTSIESHRLRSGLGLVPRRIASAGDIWRHRLRSADVDARIAACHRPYHGAIAKALNAARDRFGIAILLDIHSMPPLGT